MKRHNAVYYDQAYDICVEMRKSGAKLQEIADHVDIPMTTVQKWLKNGRRPIPGLEFSPQVLTEAWEALKLGMPYMEVARIMGTSAKTVASYFPGLGWTRDEAREYASYVLKELRHDPYEVRASRD